MYGHLHARQLQRVTIKLFNFSPAPLPANVHWEPSSYENWESDDGSKTKTDSSSDKAFNTFSWPSNTWASSKGAAGGDSQWMKDVRSLLLMEAQVPKFDTSRWNQKLEGVELRQAKMMQEGFESIDQKITHANKVQLTVEDKIEEYLR